MIHYLPLMITFPYHRLLRFFFYFIFSSSTLRILYHFPFSFPFQSQLTFPPIGGILAVNRRRGIIYHVTHVTRTNYTKHDILSHAMRSLFFIIVQLFLDGFTVFFLCRISFVASYFLDEK